MERIDNNWLLRSLRYVLNIDDSKMYEIFTSSGSRVSEEEVKCFLKKEEEENFKKCENIDLELFLNGLIEWKRGKKEDKEEEEVTGRITNNDIFKKLRVAFNLRSENIIEIFSLAGGEIRESEVSAIFRKIGHRNYTPCGNRYLRVFMKGLKLYIKK